MLIDCLGLMAGLLMMALSTNIYILLFGKNNEEND